MRNFPGIYFEFQSFSCCIYSIRFTQAAPLAGKRTRGLAMLHHHNHCRMRNILTPKWLLIASITPATVLALMCYGKFSVIKSLLTPKSVALWQQQALGGRRSDAGLRGLVLAGSQGISAWVRGGGPGGLRGPAVAGHPQ